MDQNSGTQTQVDGFKVFMTLFALFLIGASMTVAVFYYTKYQNTQALLKDPTKASKAENEALVSKLSKLIDLPNETPTVATVIDKTKLVSQPFFARSQNQDKVVIYTQAKKAILYRPATNKIIEVAPITIGNNTQNTQGNVAGAETTVTPSPANQAPTSAPLPTSTPFPSPTPAR